MRHGRALAAACAAFLGGSAAAQDCKGPNCPGQKIYPKFEHFFIKKVCAPTIVAGSCHGHFQTQWRKWEESCPNGNCDPAAQFPVVVTQPVEVPAEAPKPVVPPKVETPVPVVPPKVETAPKPVPVPDKPKLPTAAAPQQLPPTAIPPVQISIPALPPISVAPAIAK